MEIRKGRNKGEKNKKNAILTLPSLELQEELLAIPIVEMYGKKIKIRKFLSSESREELNNNIRKKKVLIFMTPPNSNKYMLDTVRLFLEEQFGQVKGIISTKHLSIDNHSACITATFKDV